MTLSKRSYEHPAQRHTSHSSQPELSPVLQHALSMALGMPARRRPGHFPFSLANQQINAPQRIAPDLLQPFVEQRKSLLLVHPELRSIPAMLSAFDDHVLHAAVHQPSRLQPYKHRRLLVVFPVQSQFSYVLQTRLDDIGAAQVTLSYQDPRREVRHHVPVAGPVTVQLAPPTMLAAIEQYQPSLTRTLSWRQGEAANMLEGDLVDLVEDQPMAPLSFAEFFHATPTWQGQLQDMSCLGACILLSPDKRRNKAVQQVVSLGLQLPPIRLTDPPKSVALTLYLLGTVRAMRARQRDMALHVRFLERLPDAFEGLFARLEQEACVSGARPSKGPKKRSTPRADLRLATAPTSRGAAASAESEEP